MEATIIVTLLDEGVEPDALVGVIAGVDPVRSVHRSTTDPDTGQVYLDVDLAVPIDEAETAFVGVLLARVPQVVAISVGERVDHPEPRRSAAPIITPGLDIVSIADIADATGEKPTTVRMWRARRHLPVPEAVVSNVPVWRRSTIEEWARRSGRRLRWEPPDDAGPVLRWPLRVLDGADEEVV